MQEKCGAYGHRHHILGGVSAEQINAADMANSGGLRVDFTARWRNRFTPSLIHAHLPAVSSPGTVAIIQLNMYYKIATHSYYFTTLTHSFRQFKKWTVEHLHKVEILSL